MDAKPQNVNGNHVVAFKTRGALSVTTQFRVIRHPACRECNVISLASSCLTVSSVVGLPWCHIMVHTKNESVTKETFNKMQQALYLCNSLRNVGSTIQR
jgi:hypothetical protein